MGLMRLGLVLAFAALGRAGYVLWYRSYDPLSSYFLHDARLYHIWARDFAEGMPSYDGVFYQAPGYQYLLGLLYRLPGGSPLAMYVLQSVAGLLTIVLIHRITTRAYDERAGLVAAALAALYGAYPFHETKLLSASVAVLLTCAIVERLQAAHAADSDSAWSIAGATVGLASVFRPNLLLVLVLVVIWIIRGASKARWRRAVIFTLSCAALILPVTVRNALIGGEFVPVSANAGVVFWAGNNPEARGWIATPGMSGSIATQRIEAHALAERERGYELSAAAVSRFWLSRGLAFVAADPAGWITLELRKAWLAFDDHEHGLEYDQQLDENPWRRAFPVSFAVILALAVIRLVSRKRTSPAEMPILVLLIVHAATLLLFYAASRFRLPATGPMLAVAGGGAVMLWDSWRAGQRRQVAVMLFAAIGAAAFSVAKLPPSGAETYRARSAGSLCDLALAHRQTDQPEAAMELYERAIERDPSYAFAHLDLGKLHRDSGRAEDAERAFRAAVRLAPGLAEAHFDLGLILLDTERFEPAALSFAEAYRLDPTLADAANNLIGCYLTLGRQADAIRVWQQMRQRGQRANVTLERWMERYAAGS